MTPRDEKIILIVLACCVGILVVGVIAGLVWRLIFNL